MKYPLLCFSALAMLSFSSCYLYRPVYYVSPYNANATSYHAMPMKKDSVKTAVYAGVNFYTGSANSDHTDKVFGFGGNIYRTQQFRNFQAYYGGDLSIGNYKADNVDDQGDIADFDRATLNSRVGNKFFAGVGANGGIDFVVLFHDGEWRAIGAEFTTHAETGTYARFRKDLPSTAANVIARSRNFSTAGLNTELVAKTRKGSLGFQLAYGWIVGNGYGHIYAFDNNLQTNQHFNYNYFTFSFQETFHRWTAYAQLSTGRYAGGGRFGTVYRLGK